MPFKKSSIIFLMVYLFTGNGVIVKDVYAKNIFKIGERMIYALEWNGIRIGVNILELEEIEKIKTKDAYNIISKTYTQGFINIFFRVKDRVETFVDTETNFPLLYKKDINEGKYHKKAVYEFNHNNGTVETPGGRYEIQRGIQDPLSILAYFRSLDIKLNDIIDIKYFSGTETRNLRVNVIRKEVVKTPLGDFKANVVAFSVGKQERNYLKTQVNLWVWFTDDDKKIPVFAKCNTSFGPVTGTLIDYLEGE
ncbi:MAG: DUF3108 domain-containing protein [bacterium]